MSKRKSPARALPATPADGVKITFALAEPAAKAVSVCGEFNSWSPEATPLRQQDDGHWETTLTLQPGQYQYKFLVDGEWLIDPAAHETVGNSFGSLNSVLHVSPGA